MSSRGSGNGQISDIITSTPNGDLRGNGGPYSPHYCLSVMFIQVERGGGEVFDVCTRLFSEIFVLYRTRTGGERPYICELDYFERFLYAI